MLKNFWGYIIKSIESGIGGKISTTRISSYLILGSILTTTAIYLSIDVVNAFKMWQKDSTYIIPSEHIVVFGMILTHHLALLGINKTAETKQINNGSFNTQLEQKPNTNKPAPSQSESTSEEEGGSSVGPN